MPTFGNARAAGSGGRGGVPSTGALGSSWACADAACAGGAEPANLGWSEGFGGDALAVVEARLEHHGVLLEEACRSTQLRCEELCEALRAELRADLDSQQRQLCDFGERFLQHGDAAKGRGASEQAAAGCKADHRLPPIELRGLLLEARLSRRQSLRTEVEVAQLADDLREQRLESLEEARTFQEDAATLRCELRELASELGAVASVDHADASRSVLGAHGALGLGARLRGAADPRGDHSSSCALMLPSAVPPVGHAGGCSSQADSGAFAADGHCEPDPESCVVDAPGAADEGRRGAPQGRGSHRGSGRVGDASRLDQPSGEGSSDQGRGLSELRAQLGVALRERLDEELGAELARQEGLMQAQLAENSVAAVAAAEDAAANLERAVDDRFGVVELRLEAFGSELAEPPSDSVVNAFAQEAESRLQALERRLGEAAASRGANEGAVEAIESRLGVLEGRLGVATARAVESRLGAIERQLEVVDGQLAEVVDDSVQLRREVLAWCRGWPPPTDDGSSVRQPPSCQGDDRQDVAADADADAQPPCVCSMAVERLAARMDASEQNVARGLSLFQHALEAMQSEQASLRAALSRPRTR